MKNLKKIIGASLFAINTTAFAQQNPTNTSPGSPANGNTTNQFWSRAGNFGGTFNNSNNIFGTMWNSPVYHFTSGLQRMTLFDNTFSTASFGPINSTPFGGGLALHLDPSSPITAPKSLLTIGTDYDPMGEGSSGWRQWMKVGTFNTDGSDFAYFGLKREGSLDRNDAVLAWGDDAGVLNNPNQFSPDYLRVIFSSDYGLSTNVPNGQGSHGLEVARFSPFGSFGIGNYYNNTIEAPFTQNPSRRIEILSDKTAAINNGNPLLRLTHTQQNPLNTSTTGLFSEFEPRNNGDLFISVRDNTKTNNATRNLKERFIGINTNAPGNTMEINSQLVSAATLNGSAPSATGWAGLRFTDLKSTSVAQANPGTNVLSVDASGDVILVPGGANTTGNNGINVTNTGAAQLGVDCNASVGVKIANRLLTNRMIFLGGRNLIFADGGRVNIGGNLNNCAVGNKLEITSGAGMPYYTSGLPNGSSGLRLTYLTSAKTPIANGVNGVDNTKVLTVDENGDVVLTNASGGGSANADNGLSTNGTTGAIHLGQNLGAVGNPGRLLNDREIPMNSFNVLFSGNNPTGTSRIAIGQNPVSTLLSSKLYTYNEVEENGVYSEMNGNNTNIFDFDLATRTGLRFKNAIHGNIHSTNTGPGGAVGVLGESNSEYTAIGVLGYATSSSALTYGMIGISTGNGNNGFGGDFKAIGTVSGINYGILASASGGATNYAGFFSGDVTVTGAFSNPSDQNLKQNVDTITNAMGLINQLKPKSFEYKQSSYPSMNLPSGKQYGLIAQDVQTILPELVNNNTHPAKLDAAGNVVNPAVNFLSLEYQQLIGIMIKGMQEQQSQIKKQDSLIAVLSSQINSCCSSASARNNNSITNQLDVELSDKDAIVLNQNVPNPFAEQTTITYNVPASVGKAQIIFFNNLGQVIQTVDIKTRGKGKVNVFANDLSSGLYNYTLVADGKVVDSKKMVRE